MVLDLVRFLNRADFRGVVGDISRNPAIEALKIFQKEHSSETSDRLSSNAKIDLEFSVADSDHDINTTPAQPESKYQNLSLSCLS